MRSETLERLQAAIDAGHRIVMVVHPDDWQAPECAPFHEGRFENLEVRVTAYAPKGSITFLDESVLGGSGA